MGEEALNWSVRVNFPLARDQKRIHFNGQNEVTNQWIQHETVLRWNLLLLLLLVFPCCFLFQTSGAEFKKHICVVAVFFCSLILRFHKMFWFKIHLFCVIFFYFVHSEYLNSAGCRLVQSVDRILICVWMQCSSYWASIRTHSPCCIDWLRSCYRTNQDTIYAECMHLLHQPETGDVCASEKVYQKIRHRFVERFGVVAAARHRPLVVVV